MKLTDTQLVLLSAASQRQDGAIELAPDLGPAQKVVGSLQKSPIGREHQPIRGG